MKSLKTISREELELLIKTSHTKAEVLKKLGYSTAHGSNYNTLNRKMQNFNLSENLFMPVEKSITTKISDDKVFCENSLVSQKTLRQRYFKISKDNYFCHICNMPAIWNNKPLTLTLDHKNGKNHDNRKENLRWICPNCDRQLPTYGAKNFKKHNKNPSKKEKSNRRPEREVLKALIRTKSFSSIARIYSVSDNAIRKWCKYYSLPFKSVDIKNITDSEWEGV